MGISKFQHQLSLNRILNSDAITKERKQHVIEELFIILSEKINRYTGGDSSLSKIRSQQLIDSIEYSISIYLKTVPIKQAIQEVETTSMLSLYQKGYLTIQTIIQQLQQKVYRLQNNLLSIDVVVYQDTLRTGLLQFFDIYDIDYTAYDIVLTLDYPTIGKCRDSGLEKLIDYINYIEIEHSLLNNFNQHDIHDMLKHYQKNYQFLIFNLTELLLYQVVLKSFVNSTNGSLVINQKELEEITQRFINKEQNEIKEILINRYKRIISNYNNQNSYSEHYYLPAINNLTTLLYYGVKHDNLKIEISYQK